MREIGEQWIEELDGVRRMVKLCESNYKEIGTCGGCIYHRWDEGDWCDVAPLKACVEFGYIVKDLGPVNEDGFLREERSGQYPDISHDKRNGVYEAYLHATLINPAMSAVLVRVQASSMDRLKEAWNWRA